ncbi:hypothetical protein [Burkholderia sp. Bp9015]|uniref:hypothetical protein n=1 Tax=Burkholderia sp. Bp9015 TaxID=2184563 RepID=UPI0016292A46|nr:hypothetical protein [Burkholderia sp. Bp9015]
MDPTQIVSLFTRRLHPGWAELHLNLRDAKSISQRVFADMTVGRRPRFRAIRAH